MKSYVFVECVVTETISYNSTLLMQIEITHRVAWRRGTAYCDANTSPSTLLSGGTLSCRSGCSGTVGSMSFYCTDYSVSEDWTSGERTYTTNVGSSVTSFEAS